MIEGIETAKGEMLEADYRRGQGALAWCDRCDILGKNGTKCPRCHETLSWQSNNGKPHR